ncbi:hypothetical protein FYJ43_03685 [Cutibacterium sp. WCA-380-WT-3A]|uniref:Uncharacterized protein n=1 Tax=Cutibacterium porci TaxID=2605781 RepID=A0A7K0J5F0_9ACTN|nr:hypothetical protein [Cutibacterium porci]MSS45165.1 hypothetical protein [Cutibacterium porci]
MPKLPARRHRRNESSEVPVVLRHVVITVDITGTLTVTADQQPHLPSAGEVWGRGDFAAILDDLTEQRRVPVRVDVYESDGSHFTDIIHAHRPRRNPEPEPDDAAPNGPEAADDGFEPEEATRAVESERLVGFLPGETVLVAQVTEEVAADENGTITPPDTALGPVVVVGRTSGTLIVQGAS